MAFVSYNQKDQPGSYTFSSRPRPVESRSKYRKPPLEQTTFQYGNIMYDRRVVRGNTYAQNIAPAVPRDKPGPAAIEEQPGNKRRVFQKQARGHFRSLTPEAVEGRTHADVQTELYLEELSDVTVTSNSDCQTDAFLDKPASPLFIPAKTGQDVGTQIEEGEVGHPNRSSAPSYERSSQALISSKLFDFDREVEPLLELLVGKVIEQSLEEVMEEAELASVKARQRAFQELRNYELVEMQRLQEQERRSREEKECRIAQQREVLKKERETVQKMAAQAYTQQYLSGLLATVLTSLRTSGYFHDPIERDIESNFLPWLMSEVDKCLEKRNAVGELLDKIIFDVAQKRLMMTEELETTVN